jgi:hypothetical protein
MMSVTTETTEPSVSREKDNGGGVRSLPSSGFDGV